MQHVLKDALLLVRKPKEFLIWDQEGGLIQIHIEILCFCKQFSFEKD